MSRMRLAVVGGGVSGLTAAYILAKDGAEVVVYEKEDTLGGQAKTVTVDGTPLDLGFTVFSRVVYPDTMELFENLGVDRELSDLSFFVSLDEGQGCEWGTRNGLSSLFAQKKNVLNPYFWNMIREIIKFKNDASAYIEELESNPDIGRNETLEHYIQSRGYSELFQKAFLIPTCASIWSCSSGVMSFSAYSILSFLHNDPALQLVGRPHRLTPRWCSQSYVDRVKKELESRGCHIRTNSEVYSVLTNDEGCAITSKDGLEEVYDGCIIAVHAPDALKMLGKQATYDESRILGAFQYAHSDLFLHHDNNLMPKNSAVWSSRNFLGTIKNKAYITYWLNNLQNIGETVPFFLTLNPPKTPKLTLFKWSTSHPIPSVATSKALHQLNVIQGKRLWFCGAYQGYGFPEDGVKAGVVAANGLLRKSYTVQKYSKHLVPSSLESGTRLLVTRFLERFITTGCLTLLEEGGTILTFEGTRKRSTLKVTMRVHKPAFYWKVATKADLGFADAYIDGDFSFTDKNEGLLNFFMIFIANTEFNTYISKLSKKRGWWTPLLYTSMIASAKSFFKHVLRQNTIDQARRNISHHYDLTPNEDLKDAQLRKIHTLIEKARISKEHHILEIGCGWGGLAIEVVKRTGCRYTGITLSEKQLQYTESKVKEAGLQDQIELLLCDYRQLPKSCKYDRIISCEMIEAVGHDYIEEFFRCCDSALTENGILVLQFIAIADDKYDEFTRSAGFIKEYIFPGSWLPSLSRLTSSMAAASRFRMRVAVVGGGISGLAAAYVLAKDGAEVVVYEEDALGGRAKTVDIGGTLLDLGFTVFSRVMHPETTELLENLGVDRELCDMSFSVSLDEGQGCEWGTRNGISTLFAQKTNVLNPYFWKMIREIIKFKNDASSYVEELENNPDIDRNETLEHFIQSRGYSELFQKAFLVPTCASIWSCSSGVMNFSAYSVLSVLRNDPTLQLIGGSQRLTPRWRSESYVDKVKKELESRGCQIRTNSEIYSIFANDEGCAITCKDGSEEVYDGCIIATPAPDALKMLGKHATHDELRILGAFQYACSDTFLHHDNDLMPKNRAVWSSRNFLGTTDKKAYITYWLNNTQNINDTVLPFFFTLNPPHTPKSTLFKWSTRHLIPSVAASKALRQLNLIQGKRRLWFYGAYQGYGFPEDGIKAGISAANDLLRKNYTVQYNRKHTVPSWLEIGARGLVARFFERFVATGCIILLEEGGTAFTFEGTRGKGNLKVTLRVHTPQFYWKVATEADVGFADAYIHGDFSLIDKNEGLLNLILIFIASTELNTDTTKLSKRRGWWTPLLYTSIVSSAKYFFKHVARQNTLTQARRNISQHYDLSNEFFSLFLDETMTYSCAMFKTPDEDLKTAQLRKTHTLIEKARISKEHHILEIGCGWGSLALEVVKRTGCKYTGITLSEKQLQYAELKVKEAGLQDRIELLLCDYRQLPKSYKYDRIISCGMIEHVGHEVMQEFFRCCESALAENGLLVLQFIAIADEKYDESRRSAGFIKEYIFPGGCAPSLSHVISCMAAASRFSAVHLEEIGCHYFHTLRRWRENLLKNQSKILAMGFNEKFIRTWEYYFDYCAAGFKYCFLGDYQIVFSRPGDVAAFGNKPYNAVPGDY